MRLYEIADDYRAVLDMMDDPEQAEMMSDTLEAIEGEFAQKADSIACMIKELTLEAEAIRQQEKALEARRKAKEAKAEWLTGYLTQQMSFAGINEVETSRNLLKLSQGRGKVEVLDEKLLYMMRPDLFTVSAPKPSLAAIKAAIDDGQKVDGARIKKDWSVRIK